MNNIAIKLEFIALFEMYKMCIDLNGYAYTTFLYSPSLHLMFYNFLRRYNACFNISTIYLEKNILVCLICFFVFYSQYFQNTFDRIISLGNEKKDRKWHFFAGFPNPQKQKNEGNMHSEYLSLLLSLLDCYRRYHCRIQCKRKSYPDCERNIFRLKKKRQNHQE